MKLLLSVFEQLSGLKNNFHKSKLYWFGKAKEHELDCTHLFGCALGSVPFKYLGIPLHYLKLCNRDWKDVEDRIEKRLSS